MKINWQFFFVLSAFAAALIVVVVRSAWLCDDAYISFRVVDNLVKGYGLTWNVSERVQAYTNPLWVFLLSFFYLFTGEIYFTSLILQISLTVLSALMIVFGIAQRLSIALWALFIMLLSKAFVDYSTSGLENALSGFVLVSFVFFLVRYGTRRIWVVSLLFALLCLVRLDNGLLVLPALLHTIFRACYEKQNVSLSRKLWGVYSKVALGLSPLMIWAVFAIVYYGFFLPNTAYAKLNTQLGVLDYFQQGYWYFVDSLRRDPLTLLTIGIGFYSAGIVRSREDLLLSSGVFVYLLYILCVGGCFMSGRFFFAPFVVSIAIIARAPDKPWPILRILLPLTAVVAAVYVQFPTLGNQYQKIKGLGRGQYHGIVDHRQDWYSETSLLKWSPKRPLPQHRWVSRAVEWREQGTLKVAGGIGFSGYYVGPDVHILDMYALAEPLLARLPIEKGKKWRIGHFRRTIPDGYRETLSTGKNDIKDPSLREYYDKLSIIVRSPVFSIARFKTIFLMNLGRYNYLIEQYIKNRQANYGQELGSHQAARLP